MIRTLYSVKINIVFKVFFNCLLFLNRQHIIKCLVKAEKLPQTRRSNLNLPTRQHKRFILFDLLNKDLNRLNKMIILKIVAVNNSAS